MFCVNVQYIQCSVLMSPDFPKLAEKLLVIRTDKHEDLVRPKNVLPVRNPPPPPQNSLSCA